MEGKILKPALRFKGFTDTWEQCKLNEIFNEVIDNRGKTPPLSVSGIPLIEIASVGEHEVNYDSVSKFLSDETFNNNLRDYLSDGDILFSTVGTTALTSRYNSMRKAAVAQNIIGLRSTTFYPSYSHYLLSNKENSSRIKSIQMTGVQYSIKVPQLLNITLLATKNYKEQVRIGTVLSTLDNLITFHQRKYDKLINVKKALLDKLFPKNGEVVPKLRFKGFADTWEQCKLGDLGKTQSGVGFPDAEQGGQIGIPFYKVSDMNTDGNEHEMVCANNYVTSDQIARRGWKPIDAVPAIMFAKVGAAVMLNRKRLVLKPFLLDNNTMAYSLGDLLDTNFGKSLFDTVYLPSLVQVGALPSYNATDINQIEVRIPSLDEQAKIGLIFDKINNLITLHQRNNEKLQNIKKALLQKMFV